VLGIERSALAHAAMIAASTSSALRISPPMGDQEQRGVVPFSQHKKTISATILEDVGHV